MSTFVTNHKTTYDALNSRITSKPLEGKSVLITGAGRGVGLYIANSISEAGATKIGLIGRDKGRIEEAKTKLAAKYPAATFTAYATDIGDEDAVNAVFKDYGVPDVLINNAGVFADNGPFVNNNLKQWWKGFETNILGTAVITQKYLIAKGRDTPGIVLNCSSIAAHFRFPLLGWSGYNSSKLGQARIFETLRFEHPEVRFISIHPGEIETDGFLSAGAEVKPVMTDGDLAGHFFAWAATEEADFLRGRFVWAEWDIEELMKKKDEILEKDLLLITIDGFVKGY
jgi:NAD(P)-dependent dehydrogenase (short-subunit alcohol dehydrogenase family)